MTAAQDDLAQLIADVDARVDEVAARPTVRSADVTAVDPVTNVVTYMLDGQEVQLPAQSGYLPEVGHTVNIVMNAGVDPVVATPPSGPMTSLPPAQVGGVNVTPAISALLVEWDEVPDTDVINNRGWYEVQVDDASDFATPLQTHRSGSTSVLVVGLDADTDYWVRVRAIDQTGNAGAWSTVVGPTQVTTIAPVDIPDGSITTAKLADDAVTAGKIAANAVTASELADLAVTTTKVTDDAITTAKLAAFAVTAGKITANTITAAQIAADTLTASEIAAGAITTAELAALSVSTAKLQANAVTANEIAANAVTTVKLDALAVTAAKIAANTITAGQIAAATLTANEITATFALRASQVVQSTTYVAGTSGWSINADGTAEFNNVTVRGTLVAPYIDAQQANGLTGTTGTFETSAGASIMGTTESTFESGATTGWTGAGATLSSQATLPHGGTRSMRIRSNAGGTVTATTPTGTAGMPVTAGKGYQAAVWLRTAVTARLSLVRVLWYKSDGSASATPSHVGQTTNDSTTYVERSVNQKAPADAAFMAVQVEVQGTAASEDHHVDDITVAETVPGWGGSHTATGNILTRLDISSAQAHSGTKSMLVTAQGATTDPQSPLLACSPGMAVRSSLWLRGNTGAPTPSLLLRFLNSSFAEVGFTSSEAKQLGTGTWLQYTFMGVAPAATAWVALELQDTSGGSYYVDDADLRLVATVNSAMYFNGDATVSGALQASSVNLLDERVLTGTTASVTLSVPSGWRHLRLVVQARGTDAASQELRMRFNGDAGSTYTWEQNNSNSGVFGGGGAAAYAAMVPGYLVGTGAPANTCSVFQVEIPNYGQTNFIKSYTGTWGHNDQTNRTSGSTWGRWNSTSAITSITLLPGAGSFVSGSRFTLYGE